MRPVRVSITGVATSSVIPVDINIGPFAVGMGVVLSGGTSDWTVEHTFDDIWADDFDPGTADWFPQTELNSTTGELDGNYAFPITGVRINQTAVLTGTPVLDFTLIQASGGIS